jgi:AraC family 4-hydroxyphenylacetate 3-monooxygenase operon regulatory protein
MKKIADIPNINIGQTYDQLMTDVDVHYDVLENFANFFGHAMPPHRHDRFFQLHYVKSGTVRVFLDEQHYEVSGPMFFLTPPTVPHAFITNDACSGHVLTIRQQLIWPLLSENFGLALPTTMGAVCIALHALPDRFQQESQHVEHLFQQLHDEYLARRPARDLTIETLTKLIFIVLLRISHAQHSEQRTRSEDSHIFQKFNALIEQHYLTHCPLKHYANTLGVTEARLNDICRRMAGMSSKHLVHDRLMQEAKRLLLFTGQSINAICYQLGFKDPGYFSRFFTRHAHISPGQYRQQHIDAFTTFPVNNINNMHRQHQVN